MQNHTSKETGASTNGGDSLQTSKTSKNEAKSRPISLPLSILITNRTIGPATKSFLIRLLTSHLRTYSEWRADRHYRVVELGDTIFIETNSDELRRLYMQYDALYVKQIVEEGWLEAEELETEWWEPKQAA